MPTDTELPPAATEGLAPQEGALQETPTPTQVEPESQPVTTTEVERSAPPTSNGEPRPFERVFGRRIDKLERIVRDFVQEQRQARPAQTGSPQTQRTRYKPTAEDWKDPETVFQRMLDDRVQDLQETLPKTLEQRINATSFQRSQQEAVKLIETNEAVNRDPEGIERMQEILTEEDADGNSLEKYANTNPKHAAQLALKEYNARYGNRSGKTSQSAPSKAQMQSTVTAVKAGAGKSTTEAEVNELYAKVAADPALMKDSAFMEKLNALVTKVKAEERAQPT